MPAKYLIMTFLGFSVNLWAAEPHGKTTAVAENKKPFELDEGCLQADEKFMEVKEYNLADAIRTGPVVIKESPFYSNSWLPFPTVLGKELQTGTPQSFDTKQGKGALVVAFLATWCLPCQRLVPLLQKLEEKYSDRYTDFLYIFAHDTAEDAQAFAKEYKLGSNAWLGSATVLENFHQPELPTIYVRDRYKWLVQRYKRPCTRHLKELDDFLEVHTAL